MAGIVSDGLAIAIDYGHVRADREAGAWDGGTLAGFRRGRLVPPVPDGSCNITAHVAMDSCAAAVAGPRTRLVRPARRDGLWWLVQDMGDEPVTDQGDLLLGVGVAAHLDCDVELSLRDFHPSGHAGFQVQAQGRGRRRPAADLRMGLMHRGAEKLFEARDYRQIMMLANRHDWLSAFSSELGIALAIEAATGITPPERATWTRMLLAEANRVAVAFAFLGAVLDEPASVPWSLTCASGSSMPRSAPPADAFTRCSTGSAASPTRWDRTCSPTMRTWSPSSGSRTTTWQRPP